MRRALLALGSTIAGLAVLLSFKSHSGSAVPPEASGGTAGSAAAAGASPGPSAAAPGSADAAGSAHTGSKAAASRRPAAAGTRAVTGTVETTLRGPMQVELTLAGQKITRVTVLQRTNDGPESQQIDGAAIPRLVSETLAAQSGRIDAVSGATYTSEGYIGSLQSALDQARG